MAADSSATPPAGRERHGFSVVSLDGRSLQFEAESEGEVTQWYVRAVHKSPCPLFWACSCVFLTCPASPPPMPPFQGNGD